MVDKTGAFYAMELCLASIISERDKAARQKHARRSGAPDPFGKSEVAPLDLKALTITTATATIAPDSF
jgi:hypothetical protein